MAETSKSKQKKERNREEMRSEFIKAALKIIEDQGTEALSTRKLSEVTGYSYATLYNYFSNISTLLQYCIYEHMIKLNTQILDHPSIKALNALEKVKKLSSLFTEYMISHPKTFELMILVPQTSLPPEDIQEELFNPQIIVAVRNAMIDYLKKTTTPEEDYETTIQVLFNHLIGRLLFYFKRTTIQDEEIFKKSVETEVNWILKSIERG